MVAARIVHARGPRNGGTQQRGSRGAGGRGGAPPRLPPPLPEARVEAAARRGRRGAAVVAVDLLDLETDLPGVEVSGIPGVGGRRGCAGSGSSLFFHNTSPLSWSIVLLCIDMGAADPRQQREGYAAAHHQKSLRDAGEQQLTCKNCYSSAGDLRVLHK